MDPLKDTIDTQSIHRLVTEYGRKLVGFSALVAVIGISSYLIVSLRLAGG